MRERRGWWRGLKGQIIAELHFCSECTVFPWGKVFGSIKNRPALAQGMQCKGNNSFKTFTICLDEHFPFAQILLLFFFSFLHVCLSTSPSLSVCLRVCLTLSLSRCLRLCLRVSVSVSGCLRLCLSLSDSPSLCVCFFLSLSVFLSVSLSVSVSDCL